MPADSAIAAPTKATAITRRRENIISSSNIIMPMMTMNVVMSCMNDCIHITMNAAGLMRRGVEKSFIAAVFVDEY